MWVENYKDLLAEIAFKSKSWRALIFNALNAIARERLKLNKKIEKEGSEMIFVTTTAAAKKIQKSCKLETPDFVALQY